MSKYESPAAPVGRTWLVEACILSYMLSNSSTPSDTFFKVRSISAENTSELQGAWVNVRRTLELSGRHGAQMKGRSVSMVSLSCCCLARAPELT
jgi:hypothetical protein